MYYQYVYKFASMVRSHNSAKNQVPLLSTLVEIQFRKVSQAMFVKRDFDEEDYEKVHFLKERSVRSKQNLSFSEPKSSTRRITSKKKDGILGCLVGITQKERSFWENLDVNESSKILCTEQGSCYRRETTIHTGKTKRYPQPKEEKLNLLMDSEKLAFFLILYKYFVRLTCLIFKI